MTKRPKCSEEIQDACKRLGRRLERDTARAQRENDIVYLQPIPAIADLPAIQPAMLAKVLKPAFSTPLTGAMPTSSTGTG